MATVHHIYHGVKCNCRRCRVSRGEDIPFPTNARRGGYVHGGINDPNVIASFSRVDSNTPWWKWW